MLQTFITGIERNDHGNQAESLTVILDPEAPKEWDIVVDFYHEYAANYADIFTANREVKAIWKSSI